MLNTDLESRILALAVARNLLSSRDLEKVQLEVGGEGPWEGTGTPTIVALIRNGNLSQETVENLAQELVQDSRCTQPSWQPDDAQNDVDLTSDIGVPLIWKGYTQLSLIGMGGGGTVYKAMDPQLNRWVALKFPRRDQTGKLARMLKEARAQARIDHPNIVKVYEVGEHEGRPFIAMQLVEGGTLGEKIDILTVEQKVSLMVQVAEGLHAAHHLGLVHMDIKPGNILVGTTEQGELRAYLTDFGLVCNEGDEKQLRGKGTPPFASPEQLLGGDSFLDCRSDIFSFGVTLYTLLVGIPPFSERNPKRLVMADPIPLRGRDMHMSSDLEAITNKCMQKNPADRYPSAQAVGNDLLRFLNGDPVLACPQSWKYIITKWLRKNIILSILGGGVIALLLSFGIWSLWSARRAAIRLHLAERYGREVLSMGQLLRMAHLSRVHDRRPAVEMVRNAMKRVEVDMAQMGANAIGPGSYALGEGYWALADSEHAHEFLDRAWQAGFRTPACAQIRGVVLSNLYYRKLRYYEGDPTSNRELLSQLQSELRDPALECFRIARKASLNTPYQEAMEAYLLGDVSKALACTNGALQTMPWLYETIILRHYLHRDMAMVERSAGNVAEAKRHYFEAARDLDQALDIAPSDPTIWQQKGWLCFLLADLPEMPPSEQEALVEQARIAFENGVTVDADMPDQYGGLAQVCRRKSEQALNRGEDPLPYLDRGVEFAEMACRKAPGTETDTYMLWALLRRIFPRIRRGLDARPDLDRVMPYLQNAVNSNPESEVLSAMGTAMAYRALENTLQGKDPRPFMQEAIRWSDQAWKVEPWNELRKTEYLVRQMDLIEMDIHFGDRPSIPLGPVLEEARTLSEKLPKESEFQLLLSRAHRIRASAPPPMKKHPGSDYRISFKILENVVSNSPIHFEAHAATASLALVYGRWLMSHGQDASYVLLKGLASTHAMKHLQPSNDMAKLYECALNILIAKREGDFGMQSVEEAKLHRMVAGNKYFSRFVGPLYLFPTGS